jgi:uncharacterized glyoxalase superfamily protein PhnB
VPDAFHQQLRASLAPEQPEPVFAARLRGRVERAFQLPKGVAMPELITDETVRPLTTTAAITPYLAVSGARAAINWYEDAFDAHLLHEPVVMPDGRIGHAELDVAGATFMLSEESPDIGVVAPTPGEGVPVSVHLQVTDVDVMIDRAVAAGARILRPIAEYDYGRNGVIRDPFGHRWLVTAVPSQPRLRHGDMGYVSLWVGDSDKAAAFFSTVLGWTYSPGSPPRGRQVKGLNIHHGLWGVEGSSTLFCCFAVDDVADAAERARSAGGTAEEPHVEPYGLVAGCTDDQGVPFAVFEPPGGVSPTTAARANSGREGDLAYVTMEVVDSARTRAFYGRVLGWRFSSGRVADGWQVDDVKPMTGLSGGHDVATAVPLYVVEDIAGAVRAVRRAGGTATEPETQPYGITASCHDDQGTRFYLGQF